MSSHIATLSPRTAFDPSILLAWHGDEFSVDALLAEMERRGHGVPREGVAAFLGEVLLKPTKARFRAPDHDAELGEISLEDAEAVGGGAVYLAANLAVFVELAAVAYVAVAAYALAVANVGAVINAITFVSGGGGTTPYVPPSMY